MGLDIDMCIIQTVMLWKYSGRSRVHKLHHKHVMSCYNHVMDLIGLL